MNQPTAAEPGTPPSALPFLAHTPFTDPGPHAGLLDDLPTDPQELARVVRSLVVHYRASGIPFTAERLQDVDTRRVAAILDRLVDRAAGPLDGPRDVDACFVGCCRDFALLYVAALRQHGVPARTRIGFATYLDPTFRYDHVVAEYWAADRGRWVRTDPQLDPAAFTVDVGDLGTGPDSPFRPASRVWTGYRSGAIDDIGIQAYGVVPDAPLVDDVGPMRGAWFVRNYLLGELAHLTGHELLLWDVWGLMGVEPGRDADVDALTDHLAAVLLDPDEHRDELLRLAEHPQLDPRRGTRCLSPSGLVAAVDPHGWT